MLGVPVKELLFSITKKDFEVQTFRAGGKGGQNANKVNAGVRIIHPASGARGEGREFRDQPQNKKAAFNRLVNSKEFKMWLARTVAEFTGEIDRVEEKLRTAKLELVNNRWIATLKDGTVLDLCEE